MMDSEGLEMGAGTGTGAEGLESAGAATAPEAAALPTGADTGLSESEQGSNLAKKLNKQQYQLLLYLEQKFWATGSLPGYDALIASGVAIDRDDYFQAWTNPKFIQSLRARGIPEHMLDTDRGVFNGRILTEQQMQVANVLLDTLDKRSRLKKLTELGISTTEYNQWLRDPLYRQYCLERAEQLLLDNQSTAHMSLIERVGQGDLGAIKYFNAMTGRYRERIGAGVEVNIQNNYLSDTLIAVVEIIQRHVKDPAVLEAIGDEILSLQSQQATQQHLALGSSQNAGAGIGSEHRVSEVGKMSGLPEFNKPDVIMGTVNYGI